MKRDLIWIFGLLLIVVLFSILVYPTPYQYTEYHVNGNQFTVKINRFTGETFLFSKEGWIQVDYQNKSN